MVAENFNLYLVELTECVNCLLAAICRQDMPMIAKLAAEIALLADENDQILMAHIAANISILATDGDISAILHRRGYLRDELARIQAGLTQ